MTSGQSSWAHGLLRATLTTLLFAVAQSGFAQVWPTACPGCCSSHGGITNSCAANGNVICADGKPSPTCACSSCGVPTTPPPAPPPSLGQIAQPPNVTLAQTVMGSTSASVTVTLRNTGALSLTVTSITSSVPGEFVIANSTCGVLGSNATCSFTISFKPSATGVRTATVRIVSTGVGSPQSFQASGTGTAAPPTPPVTTPPAGAVPIEIVEFLHREWDHYFVTGIAQELSKLDAGVFAGWERTGLSFKAWPLGTPGTVNVCRFFSTTFNPRSSHFYTPVASECTVVKASRDWSFEGEVFGVALPSAAGECPSGTVALYRLYNNGTGGAPNHRYTTNAGVRSLMTGRGWIPEGSGELGVVACVGA